MSVTICAITLLICLIFIRDPYSQPSIFSNSMFLEIVLAASNPDLKKKKIKQEKELIKMISKNRDGISLLDILFIRSKSNFQ